MVKAKQDWANMCNPILKTYPYSNITDLNFQMFCNTNLRKLHRNRNRQRHISQSSMIFQVRLIQSMKPTDISGKRWIMNNIL